MEVDHSLPVLFSIENKTSINESYRFPSTASEITIAVILAIFNTVTITGNVLVLVSILINKKLRTITNTFLVSLATADLMLAVTVVPFSSYLQIEKSWIFGEMFCTFWAAIDVLCCTASIYSLCAISMDRYIGVTRPMQHRNIMSKKRTVLLIIFIWILSVGISIGPLVGWRNVDNGGSLETCTLTTNIGYVLFSAIASFYIPAFITVAIYLKIYRAAVAQTKFLNIGVKATKSDGSSSQLLLRAHTCRNIKYMNYRSSTNTKSDITSSLVLSPKYDVENTTCKAIVSKRFLPEDGSKVGESSNGNSPIKCKQASKTRVEGEASLATRIRKFNKEKKAAKTLGIVMGVFLICWLPFFITLPLDSLCGQCEIPPIIFDVAFWLGYCNSMLNPIIYAVWNPEFKRTFKAVLKCVPCRYRSLHYALVFGHETPGKKSSSRSSRVSEREI